MATIVNVVIKEHPAVGREHRYEVLLIVEDGQPVVWQEFRGLRRRKLSREAYHAALQARQLVLEGRSMVLRSKP